MTLDQALFYSWNLIADLIAVTGIIIGYWKIDRSLTGVLAGVVLLKLFQYILTPFLLGVIAS